MGTICMKLLDDLESWPTMTYIHVGIHLMIRA